MRNISEKEQERWQEHLWWMMANWPLAVPTGVKMSFLPSTFANVSLSTYMEMLAWYNASFWKLFGDQKRPRTGASRILKLCSKVAESSFLGFNPSCIETQAISRKWRKRDLKKTSSFFWETVTERLLLLMRSTSVMQPKMSQLLY